MTPIEYAVELDTGAKLIRDDNAGTERGNREKVPDRAAEISGEKMMTHEDEISSQRIRENSSSNEIRVRVLKPAGERQRDHDSGRIRSRKMRLTFCHFLVAFMRSLSTAIPTRSWKP